MIWSKQKLIEKALKCIDDEDIKGLEQIFEKKPDPFLENKDGKSISSVFIFDKKMSEFVTSYVALYDLSKEITDAYYAIENKDIRLLTKILDGGLDIDSEDRTGRVLLQIAFELENYEAVKLILNRSHIIKNEKEVLRVAFAKGNSSILLKLLEFIDLSKILDEEFIDRLHYQTIYNNNIDGLSILLDHIDIKKQGPELFNEVLRNSSLDMVRCYISKGVDMNGVFEDKTPLMALTGKFCYKDEDVEKSIRTATLLIEKGADPTIKSSLGKRAVDYAFSGTNTGLGYFLRAFDFDIESHKKMLKEKNIPESVYKYYKDKGEVPEISCPNSYEMRNAKFCNLYELRVGNAFISSWQYQNNYDRDDPNFKNDGDYHIPVIEFIKEQQSHGANGILIWIPAIKQFGCCDNDHGVIRIFKDVSFDMIVDKGCSIIGL
ncbi:MAG: hypothetical protein GY714_33185 [Desulfobacterales bacterium]|nr:hypothetical protein [Desulfobacterales bacterium]